jgi:2-polyprenyl-3-methyl-5-hydroxy-6-metoxy-1,4-benzoquinol methylase
MDRLTAASLSGHKSSTSIYNMVLKIIIDKYNNNYKTILDFGAGKGKLTNSIFDLKKFNKIYGADIIAKKDVIKDEIEWIKMDLNDDFNQKFSGIFDVIIASEILEHLENPRHTFSQFQNLLKKNGILIITTPNNHSIRSLLNFIVKGHFTDFLENSYPAHIMPLIMKDIERYAGEYNFSTPEFYFSNNGSIPGFVKYKWQQISYNFLNGKLFSDNLAAFFIRK